MRDALRARDKHVKASTSRRTFLVRELPESDLIVADVEKCMGCRTCELICSLFHESEFNPSLARIRVSRDPFEGVYTPEICRQCIAPNCYVVCPTEGAMLVDEKTGARIIIEEKCTDCGICARACPWNMIRRIPMKKVYAKCDLCGGEPKCVEWCPTKALAHIAKRRSE